MNCEIWKDIEGYEDLYEISNVGRVRNSRTSKILKQCKNKKGYLKVNLYKNGKWKTYYIHRLVALVFIPNTDNKLEVDHINTDRTDNRVCNLRWVTREENNNNELTKEHISKAMKGRQLSEETKNKISESIKDKNHPMATKVICITTGNMFDTIKEASKFYNICSAGISNCCRHKSKSAGKLEDGTPLVWMYYKEYLELNKAS